MHRLLHTTLLVAMTAACFAITSTDSARAQQSIDSLSIDRIFTYEVVQYMYLPEYGFWEVGVAYRSSNQSQSNAVASFLNGAIDDFGMGYGDAGTRTLIEDILGLKRGVLSEYAMYVDVRRVSPLPNRFVHQWYLR